MRSTVAPISSGWPFASSGLEHFGALRGVFVDAAPLVLRGRTRLLGHGVLKRLHAEVHRERGTKERLPFLDGPVQPARAQVGDHGAEHRMVRAVVLDLARGSLQEHVEGGIGVLRGEGPHALGLRLQLVDPRRLGPERTHVNGEVHLEVLPRVDEALGGGGRQHHVAPYRTRIGTPTSRSIVARSCSDGSRK